MSLPIEGQGGSVWQVDAGHRAGRVSLSPLDCAALGHYRASAPSGLIAATLAADATLFSFRWGDATRLCVLTKLEVCAVVSAAITTAVHTGLRAQVARAFSGSDSLGTQIVTTGNNQKNRTSFGTSLLTDLRIANTAALTAGTRTLDPVGFGGVYFGTGTAVGATCLPWTSIYDPDLNRGEYPIVFAQNEGFVIRNPFAGPATGSFVIGVTVSWAEVATFDATAR